MKGRVLIAAGSDSGGGAGIQADIKAVTALDAFAMTAITALTAQNTQGVSHISPVPPAFVGAQIDTLFADVRIDAVKIGMIGSAETAHAVADELEVGPDQPLGLAAVGVAGTDGGVVGGDLGGQGIAQGIAGQALGHADRA